MMSVPTPDPHAMTGIGFHIKGPEFNIQATVSVPAGLARTADLLPLAQGLSDRVVQETARAVEGLGHRISCRKGCGACCCNLVAISEVEARRIAEVVDEMPEPRQSLIRQRFDLARQRLESAGLLPILERSAEWTDAEYGNLVATYFRERLSCPFLEAGSCSIYEDRPITCREYLVVSPPAYCAEDDSKGVVQVRMLLPVFNAVAQWQTAAPAHLMERVVPLILAPAWAAAHPEPPPTRTGPELLQELLELLRVKRES